MTTIEIRLPTFHPGQVRAFDVWRKNKYVAGRCGRRWGKTDFAKTIAASYALKGRKVGWFAPSHKIMAEAYTGLAMMLDPVIPKKNGASKMEGIIRTIVRDPDGRSEEDIGRIEFWSLENERAGRSRRYHQVIIDEVAFAKPNMVDIWDQAIEPTLLDYATLPYGGRCLVISNANGIAEDNFFYMLCETQREKFKFVEFHAPTRDNPYMSPQRLAELEKEKHPLVWQQEYLAEFVDFSGVSFFEKEKLLVDGRPVEFPETCKGVFAVIDSAVKTGKEHDGTAVVFFAVMHDHFDAYRLVVLDWDIVQIQAAMLERWVPQVFDLLGEYAKTCGAAFGNLGVYIEDASSGAILLQQCELRYPGKTQPLPERLTAAGKDERALNAASPVYCGHVKFSRHAFEKTTAYKDTWRNHLLSQVSSFRVGDRDAAKRADDLLDCFTYGIAISLGDSEGVL